jgi:hypothetical protein
MPPSLADPLAVLSVPVVMVLLSAAALCFTRRGCRPRAARQLVYPVQASILFVVVMTAGRWIVPLGSFQGSGTTTALEPLAVLAVIWYLAFALCAAWWCAAGLFRAADGHPLLFPAAAVVLSWLATIRVLSTAGVPFKVFLHDQLTKFHEQLRGALRLLR